MAWVRLCETGSLFLDNILHQYWVKEIEIFFLSGIFISRLTVGACLNLDTVQPMKLIDVNGMEHQITSYNVSVMLAIGWTSFLLSYLFNLIFYVLHPSAVDFDRSRFGHRFFFYICGKKYDIRSCNCCKYQPVPTNDTEMNDVQNWYRYCKSAWMKYVHSNKYKIK